MEDNFSKIRMQSTRNTNYTAKTSKNNIKNEFVCEYTKTDYKNTVEIKKIARTFLMLEKGIVPESSPSYRIDIPDKMIPEIFSKIKQGSTNDFIKFYQSYLRKIEFGYNQDIVDSSLEDVKTAYHTLRKCHLGQWECPHNMITIKEMENLYLLLTKDTKDKNPEEKDVEK